MGSKACSQNDQGRQSEKPLNNPMYSTSNYKHPNMAAAASRWEKKQGVAVKQPAPSDAQLANYKTQLPTAQPVGGVTVEHTPSMNLADRNYKIQRINEPSTATDASGGYYVRTKRKNADSSTIGQ